MFKAIWNFCKKWHSYNVKEVKKGSAISLMALMIVWFFIALWVFAFLGCLWFAPELFKDLVLHTEIIKRPF